jgi:hypothetical protein
MLRMLALVLLLSMIAAPGHAQLDVTRPSLDPRELGDGASSVGRTASVRAAVVVDRNRTIGLTVAGVALLGLSYVTNVVGGLLAGTEGVFFSRSRDSRWEPFAFTSLVPVLGPWIQLASKPTGIEQDDWAAWLIADGIAQALGVALIAASTATAHTNERESRARVGLVVAPSFGPQHASLSFVGRF